MSFIRDTPLLKGQRMVESKKMERDTMQTFIKRKLYN